MSVCLSGRIPIQSGRRGFECLAGSVLDEATYNQARQVLDEAQYNQAYEHLYMQSYAGVHTCTIYVAKKVLCYKMIHVSLLLIYLSLSRVIYFILTYPVTITGDPDWVNKS